MNREQVIEGLHLQSPDEFEYDVWRYHLAEREEKYGRTIAVASRYRQTGRTTRMLIDALVAHSNGERVLVVMPDGYMQRRTQEQVNLWCRTLELPGEIRVIASKSTSYWYGAGGSMTKIFTDHFVLDPAS